MGAPTWPPGSSSEGGYAPLDSPGNARSAPAKPWRSSTSAYAAPLPESAQRAAVDLAVGVLGDRVDGDDRGRHLEGHEGGAAVLEQRRLRGAPPWSEHDEADRHFAVDLVAHAN